MKRNVIEKLRTILGADRVITSRPGLEAYASDASIYSASPLAVIMPENADKFRQAFKLLIENGIAVTPRGGGSGLAGGAVNEGVLIDFSQLDNVLKIDPENRTVETECGIIYERLNHALEPYGLFFPPDPSSGDTCQIGGMLANNSSGARSVKYGTTREYVDELTVILPDGKELDLHDMPVASDELEDFFNENPSFRKIYNLIDKNREEILRAYPGVKKNVCGYDLKAVAEKLNQGIFAPHQLFIGSEGSLGVFLKARLRLLPTPGKKLTSLILFERLEQVGDATIDFLKLKPSGLELIDGNTLDLIGREKFDLPSSAQAMLICEFDNPPFEKTIQGLKEHLGKYDLSGQPLFETDPSRQATLWRARKAIVPTLYRLDRDARPWGFIEDAALPSEKVPEFIRFLNRTFKENSLTCGIFGHIGDGNLHVRPAINLSSEHGQRLARRIYDLVYDKIFELGGSATAEHGDGRLRAEIMKRMYGETVYGLFTEIKQIFDPQKLANPDVLISSRPFTDHIDTEKVVRECAACGKCNSYCPSFEVFKSERMAARGWVRVMLSNGYDFKQSKEETSGCLNCKSCFIVCPAGVDVSRYVTRRRSENQGWIASRIFSLMEHPGRFESLVKMQGAILNIFNKGATRPLLKLLSAPVSKIDSDRILPSISKTTLRRRFADHINDTGAEVAYFYGCADNMIENNTGNAVIKILERHGLRVSLPDQKCCGMPQQTYGFFDHEKRHAIYNLESLDRYKYIVFSCATCLGEVLSYPHLFKETDPHYNTAKSVASKCYDISEFLLEHVDLKFQTNGANRKRISFHQPCHLREAGRQNKAEEFLKKLPGVDFIPMDDADFCCGSAGTYGIFHYDNSMKIFARKKKAVDKANPDLVLSNCPTCILQFADGLKAPDRVGHSVELAARLCGLEL